MVIGDGSAADFVERAEKEVRGCVVGEDLAVAEVADQQIVTERAEAAGCDGYSPGREEIATGGDSLEEVAVGVELVDDSAGHGSTARAKRGIGDVESASDVLDVEGDETGGEVGVLE